jgi:hypothetical protein
MKHVITALFLAGMTYTVGFSATQIDKGPVSTQQTAPEAKATDVTDRAAPTNDTATTVSDRTAAQEIELLKRELEISRGFQSDLLSTVYWSLGIALALTVILIGYNWYSKNKEFERDKNALRSELTATVKNELATVDQDNRTALLDERTRVDDAITSLRTELRGRIDEVVTASRDELNALRVELLERLTKIFDASLKYTKVVHDQLALQIHTVKREMAENAKDYNMAISYCLHELNAALDLDDNEFWVQAALRALGRDIDNGGAFAKWELEKLAEHLTRVPEKLSTLREEIRTKVASAKVLGA